MFTSNFVSAAAVSAAATAAPNMHPTAKHVHASNAAERFTTNMLLFPGLFPDLALILPVKFDFEPWLTKLSAVHECSESSCSRDWETGRRTFQRWTKGDYLGALSF
jgi:hypothetical protein